MAGRAVGGGDASGGASAAFEFTADLHHKMSKKIAQLTKVRPLN
jgi:hypothetical protein